MAAVVGHKADILTIPVLKDEVVTAMQLSGLKTLDEADPVMVNTGELDHLVPRGTRHRYARKRIGARREFRL